MRKTFENGYNIPENKFNELAEIFYGYEEYTLYNKTYFYNNYVKAKHLIDTIEYQEENIKNFIKGWQFSLKHLEREINGNHIQLSITDNCQLKCLHCYNQNFERENKELCLDDIKMFVSKINEVKTHFNYYNIPFHKITITGGEPTLNKQFLDICDYFNELNCQLVILSNGINISNKILDKLKTYNHVEIQVSIDGIKQTHNKIRGEGSFEKSVSTIKKLTENGITTTVAFTANSLNYKEFPKVVDYFKHFKNIKCVWADRYACEEDFNLNPLNKEQTIKLFKDVSVLNNSMSNIGKNRMLMPNRKNPCSVGRGIVIDTFGNLKACGRLNIKVANLYEDTPEEISKKIKIFAIKFRALPVKCFDCSKLDICFGGSCCVSFCENKKSNIIDPGCEYLNFRNI